MESIRNRINKEQKSPDKYTAPILWNKRINNSVKFRQSRQRLDFEFDPNLLKLLDYSGNLLD